jgi:adenine C2-methylase RlmN of 23S rRNA A2503 and tRNA A37
MKKYFQYIIDGQQVEVRILKRKKFSNGYVYSVGISERWNVPVTVEVTDTFLPFYTKNAIGKKQNFLEDKYLGDRNERWMIGISCMRGCPVGCKFCATGQIRGWKNLTYREMAAQILFIVENNPKYDPKSSKEFKINYTRMGEPFLNIDEVKKVIEWIDSNVSNNTHHYISTIGIENSDYSWIKDNITLQISLHSLNDEKRNWLIPFRGKDNIEKLGQIRTKSNLKTTLNLTLVDEEDFDIVELNKYFDPNHFFIKLSPINPNIISKKHNLGDGVIKGINLI